MKAPASTALPLALRIPIQVFLYGSFAAFLGYFATKPAYVALPPGHALVRVSLLHAAQRIHPCRVRTAEELAKLPPNMRAAEDCPRERAPVKLAIELDGRVVEATAPPSGLSRDGSAVIYRRIEVPAGTHRIRARLSDNAQGTFEWNAETTVALAAGDALVVDFDASRGGFIFRR